MQKNIHPKFNRSLLAVSVVFLISFTFFSILASIVAGQTTLAIDESMLLWVNEHANPAFDSFFVAVTQLGGVVIVSAVTLLIFVYQLIKKQYPRAILVAIGVGGSAAFGLILKSVFERVRPNLWEQIIFESNFSFPSGHAIGSSALALCIVALLWNTKWRIVAICLAIIYVLVVGLSRLYLGVHYPTDIIGGWLLSLSWVALVTSLVHVYKIDNRKKKALL